MSFPKNLLQNSHPQQFTIQQTNQVTPQFPQTHLNKIHGLLNQNSVKIVNNSCNNLTPCQQNNMMHSIANLKPPPPTTGLANANFSAILEESIQAEKSSKTLTRICLFLHILL